MSTEPTSSPASTALPPSLPLRRDSGATGVEGAMLTASVFVGLLLILAVAVLWLRRKGIKLPGLSQVDTGSRIRVLSSAQLTPASSVHLIEAQGRQILLAVNAHAIVQLDPTRQTPNDGTPTASTHAEHS